MLSDLDTFHFRYIPFQGFLFFQKEIIQYTEKPPMPSVHIDMIPKSEKQITTLRTNNEETVKLRYIHKTHHFVVNKSYLCKVLLISGKTYDIALSGRDPEGTYMCSRISATCKKIDRHRKGMEENTPKYKP